MDPCVVQTWKLKLPVKFERFCELFSETEKVCMLMYTRKSQLSLDTVARNVSKNAPKYLPRLTADTLAQILHIYPSSYTLKVSTSTTKPNEPAKYHYVLVPNFYEDLHPYYQKSVASPVKLKFDDSRVMPSPPISPQKCRNFGASDYVIRSPRKSPVKPVARTPRLDFGPKFEPWRSQCRVKIFKYKLFEFLRAEHQKYLDGLENISEKEKEEITEKKMFHSSFLLRHLPVIPSAKLPVPERQAIQRTLTDYLISVQESPLLRSVEKVTKQLLTPTKIKKEQLDGQECSTPTPMKSRMNLLERIRAKEREAKEKEASRDPALEKRLSRLEDLKIRTLNVLFSEYAKHVSLEHSKLYNRLKCALSLRQDDFEAMTEILAEIAPKHFVLDTLTSKNTRYLKMVDKDLATITQIVDEEITQCKAKISALCKV